MFGEKLDTKRKINTGLMESFKIPNDLTIEELLTEIQSIKLFCNSKFNGLETECHLYFENSSENLWIHVSFFRRETNEEFILRKNIEQKWEEINKQLNNPIPFEKFLPFLKQNGN